ncbi:hypothetical protein HNQ88_002973 [Aureibacter tunicatorum]|uniref:Uncharacterized protein n=1 Tax=Aureibacter tunicatorum TaxID=866807 RepID=A0AAE3XQ01_9BACT|nr:hypothetical protein [Aureibacter tunicatorum]BDD04400.1 hypothetical protein AUTU_18830 [Aureibacter tunicatorum]
MRYMSKFNNSNNFQNIKNNHFLTLNLKRQYNSISDFNHETAYYFTTK